MNYLKETFTSGSERPKNIISFSNAIKNFFKNWANYRGRASRSEYNWSVLFIIISQFIFSIISVVLLLFLSISESSNFLFYIFLCVNIIFQLFSFLFLVVLIIPSITILIRRLHDIGYSGWHYLIYFVITFLIELVCYIISEYLFILHILFFQFLCI